jgi:hypothetical protein
MEKRLDDLQQRLQSSSNSPWCQTLANEISRLVSSAVNFQPIYKTSLTRDQLLASIRIVQDLSINTSNHDFYRRAISNYLLLIAIHTHKYVCEFFLEHLYQLKQHLTYWKDDDQRQRTQSAIIEQIKTIYWQLLSVNWHIIYILLNNNKINRSISIC